MSTPIILVYCLLALWVIAIVAMVYFTRRHSSVIRAQEIYVQQLEAAYEAHPFPDYADRRDKERDRLEVMRTSLGWIRRPKTELLKSRTA